MSKENIIREYKRAYSKVKSKYTYDKKSNYRELYNEIKRTLKNNHIIFKTNSDTLVNCALKLLFKIEYDNSHPPYAYIHINKFSLWLLKIKVGRR